MTLEGVRFPSEFWIIAKFGSGSLSLQALETSVLNRKKAHYFICFHLSEFKNKQFEVKNL